MHRPARVGLALGLGLVAPPAALAVSGPPWLASAAFGVGALSVLAPVGVALGWLPLALHDPALIGVALVWLGSVLGGGALAHLRPARPGRQGWLLPVLVAVAYLLVVRGPALLTGQLVHRYEVAGISMQPTLRTGEDLLVRRGAGALHPGDVILYDPDPAHAALPWVKRVVATAGQRVAIRGGELLVDGRSTALGPVRTETLAMDAGCSSPGPVEVRDERHGDRTAVTRAVAEDMPEQTVPDGHVFVLGDNRLASIDSRRHGPVPLPQVRGVVIGVALPWSQCGLDLRGLGRVP